jgi:acetylornithine deacetylase/succinyl-diaminopimelate desuccinylase-like protein
VIVVAVADEEAGGKEGAGWLVEEHTDLVGLGGPPPEVLGEGGYGLSGMLDRPVMPIVLGEKSVLWLELTATGTPGHGALPPIHQAPTNLALAVARVAGFGRPRVHPVMREQFATLAEESDGVSGSVFKLLASSVGGVAAAALKSQLRARGTIATLVADTATPTQLKAGYKHNVVPGIATAALDCRLLPDTDPDRYTDAVHKKVSSLGVRATRVAHYGSPVSDRGPLFDILAEESRAMPERPIVVPSLTSAMTDVRYWRQRGAHGYGWAPLVVGPELLGTIHGHDERVPVDAFERAVESMTRVVARAAT